MRTSMRIGKLEINASCKDQFADTARQALGLIKDQAAAGVPVFEGMTIQMGWSLFKLKKSSGRLFLHEPNFDKDPMRNLRRDVSCSLDVFLRQQSVIAELGLEEWAPTRFDNNIFAAHGSLEEKGLIAKHYADSEGETGWVIFSRQPKKSLTLCNLGENYGCLPVWQLLLVRPKLLEYLALPPGYTVFLRDDRVERIENEDGEEWS